MAHAPASLHSVAPLPPPAQRPISRNKRSPLNNRILVEHNKGGSSSIFKLPRLSSHPNGQTLAAAAVTTTNKRLLLIQLLSIIAINYITIPRVTTSALPATTSASAIAASSQPEAAAEAGNGLWSFKPSKLPFEAAAVQSKDNRVNYDDSLKQQLQQQQHESSTDAVDGSDQWGSEDGEGSTDMSLNKSFTLLDHTSNDSDLSGKRRQLIRQLTILIMNHEPERIAEKMEGLRVSGQLVSESEPFSDGTTTNANTIISDSSNTINSETQQQHLQQAAFTASEEQPLGLASSVSGSGSTSADEEDNLLAAQDGQLNEQMSDSAESNGSTGASNNNKTAGSPEEQYVTCSSDYEDSSMIEASSNLTMEQQQQLLAGVDSSGMLTANASTQLGSEMLQDMANNQMQNSRPASAPCFMPGSRMIEVITKVITPILFSIIIVVGLLGNIIVMIVILEDRKTEREYTPTGLLILDLSLADLSFIILCIPFTAWDYSVGHWVFGSLWCKFNQYLIVVCALSSIYTLVLMSVDRFMAIVYPIECMSYRTSKNTLYAIYIKWILILAMASPSIQMHGLIDSPAAPNQYTCRFLTDQYNPLHFQIVFFITSYLFPLILIFCLYLSLLNKLWFGSKPHGHKESVKTLESKKKVTWLVAGIVVVFAICWCPIQVMLILMRLKSHKITATYVAIQVFSHTLGYMNSCVNPIVYAFASESFLNSFKRSSVGRFCYMCLCIKNSHHPQLSTNHHNHHEHERGGSNTNFRTIHHNNNNNTALHDTSFQHQHQPQQTQHAHLQDQLLNHASSPILGQTLNTKNGDVTIVDRDKSICTSAELGVTPCSGHNETRMTTLPLEPRDRVCIPPTGTMDNPIQMISIEPKGVSLLQDNSITSSQGHIGQQSSFENGLPPLHQQTPAKQQLVARLVQSGNQAPCYHQELLKSP